MDEKKVYDELGRALSAIDNALYEIEKEGNEVPFSTYDDKLNEIYKELEEVRKDIDDGKYGGEQVYGRGYREDAFQGDEE